MGSPAADTLTASVPVVPGIARVRAPAYPSRESLTPELTS